MSHSHQASDRHEIKASTLSLEVVMNQRFNLFSTLVVLFVITSGMVVGFRWLALNIHP